LGGFYAFGCFIKAQVIVTICRGDIVGLKGTPTFQVDFLDAQGFGLFFFRLRFSQFDFLSDYFMVLAEVFDFARFL
jgi:hypothetical protein